MQFIRQKIRQLTNFFNHITLLRSVFLIVRNLAASKEEDDLIFEDVLDVGKNLVILELIKNGKPKTADDFKSLIQAHFDSTCDGIQQKIDFDLPELTYEFGKLGEQNEILKSNVAFYSNFTQAQKNMMNGRERQEQR